MKKGILVVAFFLSMSLLLKAQSSNYIGKWEVYDTLSVTTTKLGINTLNIVRLYQKDLTINDNGTFYMKHIEPKGFYINADVTGTWVIEGDELVLSYTDVFEDEYGNRKEEPTELRLVPNQEGNALGFDDQNKSFEFYKKK